MDRRSFLKSSFLGAAALSLLGPGACRVRSRFDTLIKHGWIYAGDGKPPVQGDIALRDGKIAAIGTDLGSSADLVLDADGLAVSPGFIDLHSHTDTNLFDAPNGDSRIFQGITSEVGGNCGYCPFTGDAPWKDAESFFQALDEQGIGINYASLVGHGNIREAIVGPYNVMASDDQLEQMCNLLDQQLSQGCVGLSYGLEYAPGCYCDTREMIALNQVVARHDALYAIHMRNEDDHVLEAMDEAIEAARHSGARLEISHLKAQNPANFDKLDQMLQKIDAAKAEGIDLTVDRYPYTAFATGFTSFIPIELRDGTHDDIYARLNDRAACERIREYAYGRLKRFGGAQQVLVAGCNKPDNAIFAGKNLAECCQIAGKDEWEMIRHLLISEELQVNQATFAMKEDNLLKIYRHPLAMPASDGSVYSPEGVLGQELPHPRSYGTFPRFFQLVREKGLMDLSTAIYKCTALPASRIGLKDRGLLLPGYAADITVFNPETIADLATYAKPHTFPAGIEHVFVNGVQALSGGTHTGALAGKVLA